MSRSKHCPGMLRPHISSFMQTYLTHSHILTNPQEFLSAASGTIHDSLSEDTNDGHTNQGETPLTETRHGKLHVCRLLRPSSKKIPHSPPSALSDHHTRPKPPLSGHPPPPLSSPLSLPPSPTPLPHAPLHNPPTIIPSKQPSPPAQPRPRHRRPTPSTLTPPSRAAPRRSAPPPPGSPHRTETVAAPDNARSTQTPPPSLGTRSGSQPASQPASQPRPRCPGANKALRSLAVRREPPPRETKSKGNPPPTQRATTRWS